MWEKKYTWPLIALACLIIGFTSAKVLNIANPFASSINVFDKTKTECPGITWVNPVDSTHLIAPITINGDLYFAGERVPLEDPEVKERLERELMLNTYWHSNTLACMKQANRYFGEIEEVLTANGVPTDFKYLALVESGFKNETSPAGAVGFWQFIKTTGKLHGLEINEEVDERYNYEKATGAACKYLKDAKEKLGNWTIAAGSYNLGVPGMTQRIKDQKTNNYYEMYFNPETSRYVFRMLAMKVIFSNPQKAGFKVSTEDLYQPYKYTTVEVDSAIPAVADFAAQYGLKYKHIKMLNPWLRDAGLVNKERKKYQIKILQPS